MEHLARVLFINAGSEGHINPTIGVVQELIARGEEVVYFCVEAFRERIEATGATVRTFDEQKFIKAFISGEESMYSKELTVCCLRLKLLYQAFLNRLGMSIMIISFMIPCLVAVVYLLKC